MTVGERRSAIDALLSPASDQEMKRLEQVDKVRVILFDLLPRAYAEGDIGFEKLCRLAVRVAASLDQPTRNAWVGAVVSIASAGPAPRRRSKQGLPYAIREAILGVIELVAEHEKLGKVKDGELWVRVSDIFNELGISVTPRIVSRTYFGS